MPCSNSLHRAVESKYREGVSSILMLKHNDYSSLIFRGSTSNYNARCLFLKLVVENLHCCAFASLLIPSASQWGNHQALIESKVL